MAKDLKIDATGTVEGPTGARVTVLPGATGPVKPQTQELPEIFGTVHIVDKSDGKS